MNSAAASSAAMTDRVMPWPQPALTARKSAPVSPTVVDMILMIQNDSVTSGTLLSQSRDRCMGNVLKVFSCRSERDRPWPEPACGDGHDREGTSEDLAG